MTWLKQTQARIARPSCGGGPPNNGNVEALTAACKSKTWGGAKVKGWASPNRGTTIYQRSHNRPVCLRLSGARDIETVVRDLKSWYYYEFVAREPQFGINADLEVTMVIFRVKVKVWSPCNAELNPKRNKESPGYREGGGIYSHRHYWSNNCNYIYPLTESRIGIEIYMRLIQGRRCDLCLWGPRYIYQSLSMVKRNYIYRRWQRGCREHIYGSLYMSIMLRKTEMWRCWTANHVFLR